MRSISLALQLVTALALATPAGADPAAYSAKAIRGQVVDDMSGEPLEGVIIVAQWDLVRQVAMVARGDGGSLKVIEVVTGRDGRFELPAWGPLPRPALSHLEHGYYPRTLSNEVRGSHSTAAMRVSQWDGKTIRLRKFTGQPQQFAVDDGGRFKSPEMKVRGTLQEYASWVSNIQTSLHWMRESDHWKSFPRMLVALRQERERLQAAGLDPNLQISRVSELHGGAAAVDQFLQQGRGAIEGQQPAGR